MRMRVTPVTRLEGTGTVPGDTSIHRAALFGAVARGRTEITGYLEDTARGATSCPGFARALNARAGAGVAGGSCVAALP